MLSLHPSLDNSAAPVLDNFGGGTLSCHCAERPVKIAIDGDIAHNDACGYTKCWTPEGAMFSVVGVVSKENVSVVENGDKLRVVDESATIQRHACKECGVHLYGRIEKENPFNGLDFVHAELFDKQGSAAPGFAAFVSSIIEGGVDPEKMVGVRSRLKELGLEPYDCLNPPLMDAIASYVAKKAV